MIWFTSDQHFGHKRIIELAHRPFASVEDMDETMIKLWNERIAKSDLVYHLGDFAFADHTPYLSRLNGQKRLILGNHDHSNRVKAAKGWSTIDSLLHVTVDDVPLVLCHYAMKVWNRSHYGAIQLYGHSHGSLPGDSQSLDVGVDCWDFAPVALIEIKQRLANSPRRYQEPDHHIRRETAHADDDREKPNV